MIVRATKHHSYRCAELCFFFLSGGGKVGSLVFMLQVFVSIDSFPTVELITYNQQFLLEQNCNCNWFPSGEVVTVLFLAAICSNRKHVRPFRCATWIYIVFQRMISVSNRSCLRNPTGSWTQQEVIMALFHVPKPLKHMVAMCSMAVFRHALRDFHVCFGELIGSIEIIELEIKS